MENKEWNVYVQCPFDGLMWSKLDAQQPLLKCVLVHYYSITTVCIIYFLKTARKTFPNLLPHRLYKNH